MLVVASSYYYNSTSRYVLPRGHEAMGREGGADLALFVPKQQPAQWTENQTKHPLPPQNGSSFASKSIYLHVHDLILSFCVVVFTRLRLFCWFYVVLLRAQARQARGWVGELQARAQHVTVGRFSRTRSPHHR